MMCRRKCTIKCGKDSVEGKNNCRQLNQYLYVLIYLLDENLKPLQLFLRRILIENTREVGGELISGVKSWASEQIKYCAIIVSVIPILCVYPYLEIFRKGSHDRVTERMIFKLNFL
jgi:hypothetical protein